MGCTTSKIDDLPAVALCRERCACLDDAIQQRYAFAAYHVAYMKSLKVIGGSLQEFFDLDLDGSAASPVLPLPVQKKGDHEVQRGIKLKAEPSGLSPAAAALNDRSNSNSGSHLHFHSDSDDEDGSMGSLHHSEHYSPLHGYQHHLGYDEEALSTFPGGFMNVNMNFMKNQATPSVTYQHRPASPEKMHMGEAPHYSYAYPNNNPSSYPYGYSGGNYGYYGQQPQQPYGASSPAMATGASSSKPPPAPPSPPSSSAWDFFNPFETYDKYYPPYTPSRDSKDLREEEGIPDLEDEDYQHEVVKEIHGNQKFVDGGGGGGNYAKMMENQSEKVDNMDAHYQRQSVSADNDRVEYDVHMLEKKVADSEEKAGDRGNVAAFKARGGPRGMYEVVREIQVQFERASECGNELAKMLEVGKHPYHPKNQVSSKMLHAITPSVAALVSSQPATSKNAESSASAEKADAMELEFDEGAGMRSGNLSSTLQKLHLWEKKLYDEVKVEEKMRIAHEKKSRKLKRLDERGAEAHKVDSTRSMIRSLSTKIRIAIQVVEKNSLRINKLRDDELWPQLNELIQGLTRMWKSMLECHRSQCQAIREARNLDVISSHKLSDAHLEATLQLELDLLHWTSMFSSWIAAQKGYVRALNNWLVKCLLYEPEETADGIAPFSPGRVGAPPAFVICNQWSQAMERISEKEVVDSMRVFALSIFQLWERGRLEMRQRLLVNKDLERKVKSLDRDDQKIQKEIHALDKKMVLTAGRSDGLALAGHLVYQSETSSNNSIHANLQHIFESMERFTANSLRAYEEILQRIEEDKLAEA
ncbi:hypothetical protein PVL29_002891 [Vitis rotundifolia]|uniref:BZIP transcription factor n=1 Tax=Vitis rotundifolia TaxID=103349 RepID=A0AA39E2T4_VITRO|nr:hypothetical protein PVL29_002891 [Vitis rotundifolia]